jgi:hypothetical protein
MKPRHLIVALLASLPLAVLAHHSGAMYDSSKTVTVSGKVTEFHWMNPHSSFKVEVTGADGKPEIWAVEMNAPANLIPLGWKRTTLKPGDEVTVTVRPMRNGTPGGSYVSVKLADGKVLGGSGGSDSYNAPPPAK